MKPNRNCIECGKLLSGRQQKYCSNICHCAVSNRKYQKYIYQQNRAKKKKLKLVDMMGGQCEICGYDDNLASLCFHHNDPETKTMKLDSRSFSNNKFSTLVEESKKCKLLCANCHGEIHHPDFQIKKLRQDLM